MKIRTVMPALALSAALTLGACSQGAAFNDADVTFARQMYPHHAQATEMARMVTGRTENTDVLALAERIEQAQSPEMEEMAEMLDTFGQPLPATGTGGMDEPGTTGMAGMMSAEDMTSLEEASGPAFDETWLAMMVEHHAGAVEMAAAELDGGVNPEARRLATDVEDAQQEEIATMRDLLDQG